MIFYILGFEAVNEYRNFFERGKGLNEGGDLQGNLKNLGVSDVLFELFWMGLGGIYV